MAERAWVAALRTAIIGIGFGFFFATPVYGDGASLLWNSFVGSAEYDDVYDSAVDDNGTVTCIIYTRGDLGAPWTLPPRPGGQGDCLVARFNPLATDPQQQLVWAVWLGGSGDDDPRKVQLTDSGGCIVAGITNSADFPLLDAVDTTIGSENEGFVTELDANGQLVWSTFYGGDGRERLHNLQVNGTLVTISGTTESSDLPLVNAADGQLNGSDDVFLARIDRSGVPALTWSTYLGGSGSESRFHDQGLLVLDDGTVYIAAETESDDLPVSPGAYRTFYETDCPFACQDLLIARLQPASTGTAQIEALTYFGGTDQDTALDVAMDASGRIVVVGFAYSTDFPTTPGAFDPTDGSFSSKDGFLSIFSPDLSVLAYSTMIGKTDFIAEALRVLVHEDGPLIVAGWTTDDDFPVTPGSIDVLDTGIRRGFLMALSPNGQGADDLLYRTITGPGANFDVERFGDDDTYFISGWTDADTATPAGDVPIQTASSGGIDGIFSLVRMPIVLNCPFVRGDINQDGTIDIADAISTLAYLFDSGPGEDCLDALDINDSSAIDLADAISLLDRLFSTGAPPLPAPGVTCGADPTSDGLDCSSFTCP